MAISLVARWFSGDFVGGEMVWWRFRWWRDGLEAISLVERWSGGDFVGCEMVWWRHDQISMVNRNIKFVHTQSK